MSILLVTLFFVDFSSVVLATSVPLMALPESPQLKPGALNSRSPDASSKQKINEKV